MIKKSHPELTRGLFWPRESVLPGKLSSAQNGLSVPANDVSRSVCLNEWGELACLTDGPLQSGGASVHGPRCLGVSEEYVLVKPE